MNILSFLLFFLVFTIVFAVAGFYEKATRFFLFKLLFLNILFLVIYFNVKSRLDDATYPLIFLLAMNSAIFSRIIYIKIIKSIFNR